MSIIDNLVSYWNLESDGTDSITATGNDLTESATLSYATAKQGNGVDLDAASSQYLSITDAAATGLELTGDFSVSCWIKGESFDSGAGYGNTLFAKGYDSTVKRHYYARIYEADSLIFGTYHTTDGDQQVTWTGLTWNTGTWYHIVVTHDVSEGTKQLYINGTAETAKTGGSTNAVVDEGTTDFYIGARNSLSGIVDEFDGIIDEMGLWSRVLDPAEVALLYNNGTGKTYPALGLDLFEPSLTFQSTDSFATRSLDTASLTFPVAVGKAGVTTETWTNPDKPAALTWTNPDKP